MIYTLILIAAVATAIGAHLDELKGPVTTRFYLGCVAVLLLFSLAKTAHDFETLCVRLNMEPLECSIFK